MNHMNIGTPSTNEFSAYHKTFISCVPEGEVESLLSSQPEQFSKFVECIPTHQTDVVHPPYGWTIHQVIEHIVDAERVFGYRALRFATGDETDLPGWDENEYSASAYGRNVTIQRLADEFAMLRQANVILLQRIDSERYSNVGVADGRKFSVRAVAHLMVGHLIHHQTIMKERLQGATTN